ncbi:L-aminoadipate-semialdehyde dehydrogenase-phosphopantetheinyl transferase [Takifugu flavidus]|uniref:L-aminoadipate-semialdehyde dehydrogenase-phosphopantetheinyl transferase n=1 Tax=Takifugu flavidus TaxID=433684 RepID=A0A5C6PC59_9TELE|nr:L-aminoadipate-semialdehyde dehydrogenase-phosphopantetheinyl transferase [Takifugu flavidus]
MDSVRWAFRCRSWTPSRADWLFAARCIQREEKERIEQFMFAKDAKSAMAGRLLLRRFVCEKIGVPWSEIRLERSPRGKPYLAAPIKVISNSGHDPPVWSFNLSHQGDFTVLAAERGLQVGVDLMKTTMPGSSSVPEFFRIMSRQFTAYEWSAIHSAGSEGQQLTAFYRHWALKESFIKAIGTGLGFNLQRLEFHLSSEALTQDRVLRQTRMYLDEEEESDWTFEVSPVEEAGVGLDYCNSLLSGCPNNSLRSLQLIPNAAARVLTGIDKIDHITPVLASLHWLPVKFRIIFKTLLLTYKVLRGLAPSYLEELVIPYQPNRLLHSQNAGLLVVPRVSRSRMGGRAFSYQAPLLWNQLPVQGKEDFQVAAAAVLKSLHEGFICVGTVRPKCGVMATEDRRYISNHSSDGDCFFFGSLIHVFLQESLLDADHHVAVALGPANLPESATLRPLSPPTAFTQLTFCDLIASASPLTQEDVASWDCFKTKAEAPQRQPDTSVGLSC